MSSKERSIRLAKARFDYQVAVRSLAIACHAPTAFVREIEQRVAAAQYELDRQAALETEGRAA